MTTEGLIEVRNVGLVKLPTTSAPVALALQLTEKKAPRYPTEIPHTDIRGTSIPVLMFRAGDMKHAGTISSNGVNLDFLDNRDGERVSKPG